MAEFKLKNSKGVEQIFNHNKIFVEGTDGELVQFTEGTGEVKLQDKTILENGEYTADEGFDGLGRVTVAVEGSGGGSDACEQPFVKMITKIEDNVFNGLEAGNLAKTVSLNLGKNVIVLAGWCGMQGSNATAPKLSTISSVVNLSKLTKDTSNAKYDNYSYSIPGLSYTTKVYKTYALRLLVADPMLTVKSIGGGLYDGTLNYDDYGVWNASDFGIYNNSMMLKSLACAEGVTTVPMCVCYDQCFLERVIFPSTLEAIDYRAFYNTTGVEFDFSACTAVPTLYSSADFGKVGNGSVLKIPSALFDSWSTAEKWTDWAAQMVAV